VIGVAEAPKLVTRRASDVALERVRWVWPLYVPAGKVVVLDGDPGLGKSTLTADLAARITTGKPMPDGSGGGDPGAVVLASAEDGLADTIRPRLELAGADLHRVEVIEHLTLPDGRTVPLELPGDLDQVEEVIRDLRAHLLTIDPLMAYLAGTVNANRDQDVRRALHPVKELAERTGAAILVVRHLRKTATDSAVQRGGGSIGIIGAARVGLMVAPDPADADRRILAVTKSNVGPIPPAMAYRLRPDDALGVAAVAWEGPTAHRADDLLAGSTDRPAPKRELAEQLLRELLAGGPRLRSDIEEAAEGIGIGWRTMESAKAALGVWDEQRSQPGKRGRGPSWWRLPEDK
jgi:AAA domain